MGARGAAAILAWAAALGAVAWAVVLLALDPAHVLARLSLPFAPQAALAGGIAVLAGALARRRAPMLLGGGIALGLLLALPPALGPGLGLGPGPVGGEEVRVVTFSHRTANRDHGATARLIAPAGAPPPDLILLQEVGDPAGLLAALGALYGPGARVHVCREGAQMAISRWPLDGPLPGSRGHFVLCALESPWGRITVASAHIPKALRAAAPQAVSMIHLIGALEAAGGPRIVGADFNAPPGAPAVRAMEGLGIDAFAAAGWGWGPTFPGPAWKGLGLPGLIRIDYLFVDPTFAPRAARVLRGASGSDHRPVAAMIAPTGG